MSCGHESKCTQYRVTVPDLFGTDLDPKVRVTESGYGQFKQNKIFYVRKIPNIQ
jgi:hypothetical protein